MSRRYSLITLMVLVLPFLGNSQNDTTIFVQAEAIQLSSPIAFYGSTLFADSIALSFAPGQTGSEVRYTVDGNEPGKDSPVFSGKQFFKSSTLIKAAAFHPDFRPSESIEIDFVKVTRITDVESIQLITEPNNQYKGGGAGSLVDLKKGDLNFKDPVWMGFSEGPVEVVINFKNPREIKKVIISTMTNQGAWIFLPEKIEVETDNGIFAGQVESPGQEVPGKLSYEIVQCNQVSTKRLHIRIVPLSNIPEWHPGAGYLPWFFMDEIIIK
ncbi:MAG: hypothetical protein DWQ02_07805 [Bacteroidetes bacterium]|nr:MAG: hypothetical protein DWQ02_07805 [Bacteroidota bacterium]